MALLAGWVIRSVTGAEAASGALRFVGLKRPSSVAELSPMPGELLQLPRPRPTVVYRDLPEGAILFCTSTEVYYSLNSIGARIWRLLPPTCTSEEEVVARLSEEYPEVNLGKIAADVRRLLSDLIGNGLADDSRAA